MKRAAYTNAARGWVKGEPIRFVHGHHRRKRTPEYIEEDRGFTTPCWIWQRARTGSRGYGTAYVPGDRQRLAHRVYYERYIGPIPKGLHIDHLCEVSACVNPDHLEAVTCRENLRRGRGTKLSLEQVREMVLRRLAGERAVDLAKEFGVESRAVFHLARGAEAVLEG